MSETQTLQAVEKLLARFIPSGPQKGSYTLERMTKLMGHLDDPQEKISVIHVAGTSGKTSTCYYISSLLASSGLKVGLTVSPHVTGVNERLQVNNVPIEPEVFDAELEEFLKLIDEFSRTNNQQPTYFEVLMAFAYWYFAKSKVDIAVIETGFGGLLDGSNVVSSPDKICVITDIGLDHTEILGNDVVSIAKQKAGIIQPNNSVFMLAQPEDVENVVRRVCESQNATLQIVKSSQLSNLQIPKFQNRNLSLACKVANYFLTKNGRAELVDEKIIAASKVTIPGRFEIFKDGDKTIVIDGAHNPQKVTTFCESFIARFPEERPCVVVGFRSAPTNKIINSLVELLLLKPSQIIATSFSHSQDVPIHSVPAKDINSHLMNLNINNSTYVEDPLEALTIALKSSQSTVVIIGSLYLASILRPQVTIEAR